MLAAAAIMAFYYGRSVADDDLLPKRSARQISQDITTTKEQLTSAAIQRPTPLRKPATGSWELRTAILEALLLLAAGACLLMRSGGGASARHDGSQVATTRASGIIPIDAGQRRSAGSTMHEGVSRAADTAAEYASEVKDRVSDTARGYANSVSEFADDARRAVSERSERWQRQARSQLQGGMERVLREQPLAVAVAGLAAGVAVAALLPLHADGE